MKKFFSVHILVFIGLWGFMIYTIVLTPPPELSLDKAALAGESFEVVASQDPSTTKVLKDGQPLDVHIAIQDQPLIQEGSTLKGHFFQQGEELWVDQIWPGDPAHTPILEAFAHKRLRERPSKGPIHPGKRLPSFLLYNSQGQLVDEQTFLGKPLILSFFFSRCQVPEMCPTTLKRFQELQDLIASQSESVHLVLVTLDPDYDTPGLLSHFSQKMGFDPNHISLLTGPLPWVDSLGHSLGIASRDEDGALLHNLVTCLVDSHGILRHRMTTNTWSPQKVLKLALDSNP